MRYQGREVDIEGRVRLVMESTLTARDRVGVQDFLLLENHNSEAAFIENLRRRFRENLIYTYIGSVLVSVNPCKELEIYSKPQMDRYRGVGFYEIAPHIFAVSENAYRAMRNTSKGQCILISGESGAGKTEASKKILLYYAVNHHASTLGDRLLQSASVLEAFGNAKTLRNDNSSRFGKYMDVQFDFKGTPAGGHITTYLLEKSRVVHQNHGQRNFHVFYQLLDGGSNELLQMLDLERNPQNYDYLVKGSCSKVGSVSDKNNWKVLMNALSAIGFTGDDLQNLLNIVASVLHLGNAQFGEGEEGATHITAQMAMANAAKLLGLDASTLGEALTHKKLSAKGEEAIVPLNFEQAMSARDALARAVYGWAFAWLVEKLNRSLALQDDTDHSNKTFPVIGLVDIYGFEVLQRNSFEQFCVNYCSEKLQQLFIALTLRSEQEEYTTEEIAWETVPYFDNKIICDLIEEKHKGIVAVLDEESLRPGETGDALFLEKLEDSLGARPHFVTHKLANGKVRKPVSPDHFRLLHYAGEVNYDVAGFLEKNNDSLNRSLKEVMRQSDNQIIRLCFSREEVTEQKRPQMAAGRLKKSLLKLSDLLAAKEPSYVRCVKANDTKQPGQFDQVLVRHQVRYLGLMETLRVRRAGFAYRRSFEAFLQRYKPLCPATWPNWYGSVEDGVAALVEHLGYHEGEYKLGRSKIFIRNPKTLFLTEDALQAKKPEMALMVQTSWRGYRERAKYKRIRHAVIVIQSAWRGTKARRRAKRRRRAADLIRSLIKGFIYRHQDHCAENAYFLDHVRYSFLKRLSKNLPTSVLDKSWPASPRSVAEASEHLRTLHVRNMVVKYCTGIRPEWKNQMTQKVVASQIFKEQKDSYPQSVGRLFLDTRIERERINLKVLQTLGSDKVQYGVPVTKYDRRGFKPRPRQFLLSNTFAVLVDRTRIKERLDYAALGGISVSSLGDGMVILHVPTEDSKQKGDLLLHCDHVIELVTKLALMARMLNHVNVKAGSVRFAGARGHEGVVDFVRGSELKVAKGKRGHLLVDSSKGATSSTSRSS
ncbi:unconventional myosin-Ic-like isoform X2 [Syngnathoides biaculeatus]|uniref:unconventional myosin-Ic-like isoform X2 n=1 Tax=Syngnathoides biaculeatus TaxID=300417 RepID=UPI002ADE228C|nr:unconventional myosin-Ic-like isoform X2 [Syngnathoides biaculeatus]